MYSGKFDLLVILSLNYSFYKLNSKEYFLFLFDKKMFFGGFPFGGGGGGHGHDFGMSLSQLILI